MNSNLILDYNDKPKKGMWALLSIQHVFAMFSATVLVPMLTGLPISTALFASGVGTLIYILCTKGKVPIYLGSSFAYITYICVAGNVVKDEAGNILSKGPYGPALTGLLVVGLIYVIVALIIKFAGVKWLKKLLPPVVIGPMIMVIGLGLSSSAVSQTGIVAGGDIRLIIGSIVTMLIVAICAIRAKGFFKVIPFLIGILGGYLVCLALNWIGDPFMDFTSLVNVITNPKEWFGLPEFIILGWKEAEIGAGITMTKVSFAAAISVIPLAFATLSEHIGDHQVLGKITGKDYMTEPGLHRTILGDGIATSFAALIGGPANTSYGENTSVVGITKVGSVWVTGGAACVAILLSFCRVFTSFIATIPGPVMGGICLILYGFIASNGLKTIVDEKVNLGETRNVIIISVMLVIGLGGAVIKIGSQGQFAGAALAMIFGIILNLILPKTPINENKEVAE